MVFELFSNWFDRLHPQRVRFINGSVLIAVEAKLRPIIDGALESGSLDRTFQNLIVQVRVPKNIGHTSIDGFLRISENVRASERYNRAVLRGIGRVRRAYDPAGYKYDSAILRQSESRVLPASFSRSRDIIWRASSPSRS